jgi:hypothetical protein
VPLSIHFNRSKKLTDDVTCNEVVVWEDHQV